jgi:forespore regulator of the sigma-K checkpoint
VSRFRILKEIKKSLKRKRRHVWSLGAGVAFFILAALVGTWLAHKVISSNPSQVFLPLDSAAVWWDNPSSETGASSRDRTLHALKESKGQMEVVLHRTYLCGEETRHLGTHTASEAEDLLRSHREWGANIDSAGRLLMEESIDDLSPQCRKTAYMGMDKDGNLSLYDGPPWEEKVIRTFFQLDVDMLESRLTEERVRELSEGIRVSDKDEYNSVLSTFNEYASMRSQATVRE